VLLPLASTLPEVDARMLQCLTPDRLAGIVALIPDEWLAGESAFAGPEPHRAAYLAYLNARLQAPRAFVEEAVRARSAQL
jgi:hypothetical protein